MLFAANAVKLTRKGNTLLEDEHYKIIKVQQLSLHCLLVRCRFIALTKVNDQYCTKVVYSNVLPEMIRRQIETTQTKFDDEAFCEIKDFQHTWKKAVALLELKNCLPPIKYPGVLKLTFPLRSTREKIAYVRMHILTPFIKKNYSYLKNEFEICQPGILLPLRHDSAFSKRFQLKIKHTVR